MNLNSETLLELKRRIAEAKLSRYRPYGHPDTLCPDGELWQLMHRIEGWRTWSNNPWQLRFHAAGRDHRERMIMAANRVGKTLSVCMEIAYHATGKYPTWWTGRRFSEPVLIWCGSITSESSRDIVQAELFGGAPDSDEWGTGVVPPSMLGRVKMAVSTRADVIDFCRVKHVTGGWSKIQFKAYDQGWRKWQGVAPHVILLDEEPDPSNSKEARIFSEAQTRIMTSRGLLMVAATPLLGKTNLVNHFMSGRGNSLYINATWDDAPHLDERYMSELREGYEEYEIETRTEGTPMMGRGRVFITPEREIKIAPFPIPDHWARIAGHDFGRNHPASTHWLAHDRNQDVVYVTGGYRRANEMPVYHASAIKRGGVWIPCAWPHDGLEARGSNIALVREYAAEGANMLTISARYEDDKGGRQDPEIVVKRVNERERTGRFKIFANCTDYLEERRNYHRKDNGKLNDINDDALKSAFYAMMMLRYAESKPVHMTMHRGGGYTSAIPM